jgi:hypothetical protein
VIEDVYLTAPEGPLVAELRLTGLWPWIAIALGATIVTLGGLLLR